MKQVCCENYLGNQCQQNCQNISVLKNSSKENMQFPRNGKTNRNNGKDFSHGIDLQIIQKSVRANAELISKQKQQIIQLKAELDSNKSYTWALEQKYTILLQSIQPSEQNINTQKLVQKIAQLENKLQAVKREQGEVSSFKLLKLTQQSTSVSTSGIQSVFLEELSETSQGMQTTFNLQEVGDLSKSSHKLSEKETVKGSSDNQQKVSKQITESEIGIQVTFADQHNTPVKRYNIQKFISLEAQMKNNEINLSRKRKNSEFQENQSAVWQKFINEYLNNEQLLTTTFKHKTEHLLKKFVPYELRSTVWPMVFQNHLGISWQLYMQLLQRRQKGWVQESVKVQIQKDLNRSFTGKGKQIENKDKLIDQVRQVLELFHIYRPDVSYVQGMTYPAILLTTVVGKMKAFCILANQILGTPIFRRLYTFEGNYPSIYCRTFDYLLKDVNSNAYDLLQKKDIHSQIFLIQWFYTFFSRGLRFQTTLKIWDHLAYFGEVAIFKLAVSVVQLVSQFLADTTYEGSMALIKQFSSFIDEKKLIDTFVGSKVTQERYKKAYRKAVKSFHS